MRVRGVLVLTAGVLAAAGGGGAIAQPQLPSSFFGTASIDGQPVPNGTQVRGFIDGVDCTQGDGAGTALEGGVAAYVIDVVHESQRPGCGNETKTVTFTIGGRPAAQTAKWKAGPQEMNLNAGTGAPVALPTATATPAGGGTAGAGGTARASVTGRLTPTQPAERTPPTDDVTFITPRPPGGNGDPKPAVNDGGAPVGLFLLLGLVALAAGGGGIGYAMSRRPRGTSGERPEDEPGPDDHP